MKFVWGVDAGPFVGALAGTSPDFGNCRCLGVLDDNGEWLGAVIFHNWNDKAGVIEVSAAFRKRGLSRRLVNICLWYVFDFVGCQMVLARSRADNLPVYRTMAVLRANAVTVPRLFGRDADGVIYTLTKEQWAKSPFKEFHHGLGKRADAA